MQVTNKVSNPDTNQHLIINSIENAIDSLEMVAFMLSSKYKQKWKWIVIALDHALYMFCVVNLEGSNYSQVINTGGKQDEGVIVMYGDNDCKKSKRIPRIDGGGAYTIEWIDFDCKNFPNINVSQQVMVDRLNKKINTKKSENLIGFWTAFARVQSRICWMSTFMDSKPITVEEDDWIAITWLHNEVRNDIVHFVPKTMTYGFRSINFACRRIVGLIQQLAFDTWQVNYKYNIESKQKERIKAAISLILQSLSDYEQ